MPNLDETANALWLIQRPPLGLLAATCCSRVLLSRLSPDERAPFDALSSALLGWWPAKERATDQIYAIEFAACIVARDKAPARLAPALSAAYVQMAALLRLAPRSLPRDGFYDMGPEDFTQLVQRSAKHEHVDLAQWRARLEHLRTVQAKPWNQIVELTSRMGFGRLGPLRELSERARVLARSADLGATWSWSRMGERSTLRLELGDAKRTAVLDDGERDALCAVVPWIAEA